MHARNFANAGDAACVAARLATQPYSLLRRCILLPLLWAAAASALGASNVVEYTYDAAGNIIQIGRQAVPGFQITGFDPRSGPAGTQVTIYGAGFDPVAANNSVAFNGVAAAVTASANGSLVTSVPAGASTGRITVTVGGTTATSASDFVVTLPSAPTITGFTPPSGIAGATISVSGTNFDPTTGASVVKVNGAAAAATVSNPTDLSLTVPGNAASGKLTVTTAGGTAVSTNDFIVPPPGMATSDIAATIRAIAGAGYVSIAVPTGKSGLVLFDAQPDAYYSIQFAGVAISPSTATAAYKLVGPDNTVLITGSIGGSNRPSIHLPKLSAAGTYSVVLSPGSATLNTNVRVEINPVITVDGAAASSTLDSPYQSARFVFDAAADQRIGIGVVGVAFTPAAINTPYNGLRVFRPDGTEILPAPNTCAGQTGSNPEGNCDGELLAPVAGTYTAILESPSNAYGQFSLQLTSEVTGTLTPDVAQPVALARVGQDARYTFSANSGDSLAIDLSNAALQPRSQRIDVDIYRPDGTLWKSASATPPRILYLDLGTTLPASGTYTLSIDPLYGAYGTFNVTLKQGPVLRTTDPATPFAPAGVTESARFRFDGTAGQNLSAAVFDLALVGTATFNTGLNMFAPDGSQLTSTACPGSWTRCRVALKNLPQTGTYSVEVQPPDSVEVSGNVILSDELVGTLSAGVPVTISRTRPGQLARYTFQATAGDSTGLRFYAVSSDAAGSSAPTVNIQVLKPGGLSVASGSVSGSSTATMLNLISLPVTGEYTVVIDPPYGASWQGIVELVPGTPIAIDGPTISPTSDQPGEPLRYSFEATAGQRIEFGMSGLAYAAPSTATTAVVVTSPAGSSVFSTTCSTSNPGCEAFKASAPATGTYVLTVTPPAASSIVSGTFALSTPVAGSLTIGDPPQVLSVARPGQTARYAFAGSSGQLLQLSWNSPSVSGATNVSVSVLKPDGGTLTSGSMANGTSNFINVPSLPSSGSYTVVFDPPSGATFSASVALITR